MITFNKNRIFIKLQGGLGNQMFQYAFGRMLAFRNKAELMLDVSFYKSNNSNTTKREFALDAFPNIKAQIARSEDLDGFECKLQQQSKSLLSKLHYKLNPYQKIIERQFHFDYKLLDLKGNLYLVGYWQAENYFKEVRNSLINEFSPQITHPEVFDSIFIEMKSSNSVSLHIRRGDYVSDAKTSAWHGVLPVAYYQRAIDQIENLHEKCRYFVFSDEPQWVEENMNLPLNTYFVSGKGLRQAEELYLMSKCNHNIIANSSFSWWGAWLNQNEQKQVIAPKKWFANDSLVQADIYANGWTIL